MILRELRILFYAAIRLAMRLNAAFYKSFSAPRAGDVKIHLGPGQKSYVVVPSYTENFAMVVAEALASGVPVIASRETPWRKLEEIGCGFWVDNDPESLAQAIHKMSKMPLREMGQRGREWMQKEFSWRNRAGEMMMLYQTLVRND